jgi:DNA-directed RNA polymerase subunit omega
MVYVPLDNLLYKVDSIFKLTILSAQRASELNRGAPKLVKTDSKKAATIALEEIAQGKIGYKTSKK